MKDMIQTLNLNSFKYKHCYKSNFNDTSKDLLNLNIDKFK